MKHHEKISDQNNFYVYIYYDRDEPIYVGKGKELRYLAHWREACKTSNSRHFLNRIRKIRKEGRCPNIYCPAACLTEKDAFSLEIQLISKIGRRDLGTGPLLNLQGGGTGGAISPDIVRASHNTPEYKAAQSEKIRQYWSNLTEEQLEKRKEAARRSYTPELRQQRSIQISARNCAMSQDEKNRRAKNARNAKLRQK